MTWDMAVQMLMEVVEDKVVKTEIVVPEVALLEHLVVVQSEFVLLNSVVPRLGSSGHSPLPAK